MDRIITNKLTDSQINSLLDRYYKVISLINEGNNIPKDERLIKLLNRLYDELKTECTKRINKQFKNK